MRAAHWWHSCTATVSEQRRKDSGKPCSKHKVGLVGGACSDSYANTVSRRTLGLWEAPRHALQAGQLSVLLQRTAAAILCALTSGPQAVDAVRHWCVLMHLQMVSAEPCTTSRMRSSGRKEGGRPVQMQRCRPFSVCQKAQRRGDTMGACTRTASQRLERDGGHIKPSSMSLNSVDFSMFTVLYKLAMHSSSTWNSGYPASSLDEGHEHGAVYADHYRLGSSYSVYTDAAVLLLQQGSRLACTSSFMRRTYNTAPTDYESHTCQPLAEH